MDDEVAKALLEELKSLRAEVAELKARPAPVAPVERPAHTTDLNGNEVVVSSGHRINDRQMADRYQAEFLTPMRANGLDPNSRPNLALIFADIPAD